MLQPSFVSLWRKWQDSFWSPPLIFLFLLQWVCLTDHRVQTSFHNTSTGPAFRLHKQSTLEFSEFHLQCWFCRYGQLSIKRSNPLPETDCCWAGSALEQQNKSTKNGRFKAKNGELKTTGVNCLSSCHKGSLSWSRSPDLMCKIDISVLSIFLYRFILPCAAKSAYFFFFFRQLNMLPPQHLEMNLIFLMGV